MWVALDDGFTIHDLVTLAVGDAALAFDLGWRCVCIGHGFLRLPKYNANFVFACVEQTARSEITFVQLHGVEWFRHHHTIGAIDGLASVDDRAGADADHVDTEAAFAG
jgi:hypothetical protein